MTGGRTFDGTCTEALPFDLEFLIGDNQEVVFNTLERTSQFAAFHFNFLWDPENAELPIPRTIFSYTREVKCDVPLVDPEGDGPFSESCIGVKLCEGTPVRGCGGVVNEGPPFGVPTDPCEKDTDCAVGVACEFLDLEPPVPDGFPDLVRVCDNGDPCQEDTDCTVGVCNEDATGEYVCICEENVLYLGPTVCSNDATVDCTEDTVVADCNADPPMCVVAQCIAPPANAGNSCSSDSDCANTCVEHIVAEQCLFFTGDARFKRGGGKYF